MAELQTDERLDEELGLDEAAIREIEEEAELLRAMDAGTAAVGLAPVPQPGQTNPTVAMRRFRRVKGVRGVRLARSGEYDEEDWPGEEPPGIGGDGVMWVIITFPFMFLIWLLSSLFGSEFITRGQFGSRLSDADLIDASITNGTQGFCTLVLRSQEPVRWFKAIELRDVANTVRMRVYTQDARRSDRMMIPNSELRDGCLAFWKAKQFGIHAMKYTLGGLYEFENKQLTLTWKKDAD